MSVRPRYRRNLAWSFEAYVRPDLPEREVHARLEELLPEGLVRGHIAGFAKKNHRPASFVMGFSADDCSTYENPAYLLVSARCESGAMSKEELQQTCGRALQEIGLRLWLPAEVTAFPGPLSFARGSRRRVTKWNWNKAFTNGPHHASHYRRIGKQQDRRRARHAIDQALRSGRYTEPVSYGPLARQVLVPPRGLEDIRAAPADRQPDASGT